MTRKYIVLLLSVTFSWLTIYAQDKQALAKSDSLFAEGVELYKAKKYREAIPLFIESDKIDKAELDSTSNRREYSAMWLASCYYHLGDTIKAKNIHAYYHVTPIDRRLTIKSDSLSDIGYEYYDNGEYAEALDYFKKCAEIEKTILGDKHIWYANTLYTCAKVLSYMENYAEAIQLDTIVLNIYESMLDKQPLNYAMALYSLADYNSELGNYSEAIRLGAEVLSIVEKLYGKEHPDYALLLNNLAEYNSRLENYSEAIRLGTEALNLRERLFGKEHPDYIQSLSILAEYNNKLGNYSKAIQLETEVLGIREKVLGKDHVDYATSLANLSLYNGKLKNYNEAIRFGTETLDLFEKMLGKEYPLYASILSALAVYNCELYNYNEAIRLETEALNLRERLFGKEHLDYASALRILANAYAGLGNYSEAVRLETEALNLREQLLGKDHSDYAESLRSLASHISGLSNYNESIKLVTKALNIQEKLFGKEHPYYAVSLHDLAGYICNLGNYNEAIQIGAEALRIRERLFGKEHPCYAISLGCLASYYAKSGDYNEAIRLETEALNISEKLYGKEHPNYAVDLHRMATFNSNLGNYSEAIRQEIESLDVCEKVLGKEHPDYAISLAQLADYKDHLGDYNEAMSLGIKALGIIEKQHGKESYNYAQILILLSRVNCRLGNYSEALRLGTEALSIHEKLHGRESLGYNLALSNLANSNAFLGNYEEAIRLQTENLNIEEKVLGKEHPSYATSLSNLGSYHFEFGNYEEAIRLQIESLNIREKVLGKDHPSYASLSGSLAISYYQLRKISLMTQFANATTHLTMNLIRKTFGGLTAYERNLYWKQYQGWFRRVNLRIAYEFPTDSLIINAYNGILLSKGLLLNSDIEMNKLLLESGDKEIVSLYGELQQNRQTLNKLYEKPIAERYLNTDSLENVVNRMERDLVQRSKAYGDYTRNLAIGWEDVQKKLGEKDIAVEFVSFPHTKDSTMYAAFVLKSDMETPQMVSLFEAKELSAIHNYKYYTTPEVSKLVWGKLENYLNGCDNIYFAPAGELYNIAIESLPDYNGDGLISDRYNMYRLSSTRELAVTKDKNAIKEATLYGGLKYDTDTKQMEADSKRYQTREMPDFELFNIADSLNLRSGASYLPATKVEAENINNSLTKTSIQSSLFTDTLGTEASFKNLSGKKTNLLHIATHGFYWNEQEAQQNDNISFLMFGDDRSPRYVEDKALTRSGLLFSGANNALTGKALPENVEDGILTAKEISVLDLRGLDLVVLSACQTGLGEITGDGVFGLQRGFKKAGANTLMMSLWKVDDNATQLLMSKFYENLIAGKGKYESLRDAQRYVREYEPGEDTEVDAGKRSTSARRRQEAQNRQSQKTDKQERPYQSPEYWAAFILLDGIN